MTARYTAAPPALWDLAEQPIRIGAQAIWIFDPRHRTCRVGACDPVQGRIALGWGSDQTRWHWHPAADCLML